MAVQHAERAHSIWSASSTAANVACPGRIALTMDLPETTSEAADWGTACHQISEKCLSEGVDAAEFVGTMQSGKEHSFEVDDEMAETAQVYVDYVRAVFNSPEGAELHIEQRFSLASLDPPFEAGGTADAVIYLPIERRLEVVDLKGGRGVVVDVTGNPQLRTYALGAMLANGDLAVDAITVTIVQPRAPHKNGRIRSETFHVSDLLEWTADLMIAMNRSRAALDARGTVPEAAWSAEWLKAGDHCKFCPATGFCPALKQKALDAVGIWFDDTDQPRLSNAPSELSPEALARSLDMLDMIGDWVNGVRAYAQQCAENGVVIPNYLLVQSEGREKFVDDAAITTAASMAAQAGVPAAKIFNPAKIRTPKQVRAEVAKLNKKMADEMKTLSAIPVTGTSLVRADKTTRAAVAPAASRFFEQPE